MNVEAARSVKRSRTQRKFHWSGWLLAITCNLVTLPAAAQLLPTHWLVTVGTTSDAANAPGCSLRQAIESQNTATDVADCERVLRVGSSLNRIRFAPGIVPGQIFLSQQLDITSALLLEGPGADVFQVSGSAAHRIFNITSAAQVVIQGMTLTQGFAAGDGGAIYTDGPLTIENSRVLDSATEGINGSGGGIATDGGGLLEILSSEISGNTAGWLGGGIYARDPFLIRDSTLSGNESDFGGALLAVGDGSLEDSIVADNTSRSGASLETFNAEVSVLRSSVLNTRATREKLINIGFTDQPDNGIVRIIGSLLRDESEGPGGFAVDGGVEFGNAELIIKNSTLAGSRGIEVRTKLELLNSTVTVSQGIAVRFGSSNAEGRIANSIVVSDTEDDCVEAGATLLENSHNIYTDGSCTANQDNLLFTDPLLGPLQDNGGPTLTRMPSPNSPAINAGSVFCQAVDQRSFARTDGSCDIGAVEFGAVDELFSNSFE